MTMTRGIRESENSGVVEVIRIELTTFYLKAQHTLAATLD